MAFSKITYTYSGQATFAINFTLGYLEESHVTCRVNDEVDGGGAPAYRALTFVTEGTVSVGGAALVNGDTLVFERTTPKDELQNDFQNGSLLIERNLDDSYKQALMIAHEALDGRLAPLEQELDMNGLKIINLANGVADTDAANMSQINAVIGDAQDWATKVDGIVNATDYSSKAWSIGGTGVTSAAGKGAAKEWAITAEDTTVDGTSYSALHWAAKASADATATAADRVQTGLDVLATNADVVTANAAAAAAASSAAEGLYNDVITITNADSPYVPSLAQEGTLFRCDTSGGAVIVNLSELSATYGEDMKFAFVKTTGDAGTVTINRGGTDTIEGGTSQVISVQWEVNVFVGDSATGSWVSAVQTAAASDVVEDASPQLGGDLDMNGNKITSPDGTDSIAIPNGSIDLQTASTSRLDVTDSGVRLGAANARVTTILDEDAMGSDSATALCTQQSIKAYVDNNAAGGASISAETSLSGGTTQVTGLSSSAKVIIINIEAMSVSSGTGGMWLRIGPSGGVATTGYTSALLGGANAGSLNGYNDTVTFPLFSATDLAAGASIQGSLILTLKDSTNNTWVLNGFLVRSDGTAAGYIQGGTVSLSGAIERFQFGLNSGNTFDAGTLSYTTLT